MGDQEFSSSRNAGETGAATPDGAAPDLIQGLRDTAKFLAWKGWTNAIYCVRAAARIAEDDIVIRLSTRRNDLMRGALIAAAEQFRDCEALYQDKAAEPARRFRALAARCEAALFPEEPYATVVSAPQPRAPQVDGEGSRDDQ